MSSKRELRQQRKEEQLAKFEATKAAQIQKVISNGKPKTAVAIHVHSNSPVIETGVVSLDVLKKPKAVHQESRYNTQMMWCTRKKDIDGHWGWGEPRAWQMSEWNDEIIPSMSSLAKLTWGEIDKFSSDTGHKMHHSHDLGDLSKEAQNRWLILELDQYDVLFRFRFSNKKRAWGFEVQSHFFMVWWERNHQIYPVG